MIKQAWQKLSGGPRERQALAFLRVMAGMFFLYQGHHKLTDPHFLQDLTGTLRSWAMHNPIEFYRQFLEQVAIPNASLFGALVTYGEILVGLSFVLGFLVQFSAPAAAFMSLNFLLATQHTSTAAMGINLAFLVGALTLFWGRAGHHYGFDEFVFAAKPGKPAKQPLQVKGSKKLKAAKDLIEKGQKAKKKPKTKSKPFNQGAGALQPLLNNGESYGGSESK